MDKDNPLNKVEIFRKEVNNTLLTLNIKILENGDVSMEGQDIGEAPKKVWGSDEYEYMVKVPSEHKDRLILLLIKDRFNFNSNRPSSDFMDWLKLNGIPHEFFSWP